MHEIAIRFQRPFRIPDAIPTPGNIRYRRAVSGLNDVVYRIVQDHRVRGGRGDLLDLLMEARDDDRNAMTDNEGLRLYPPAYAFGREALRDCEIGGYHIPAGATVFVSPWVMHRDPRYFERPEEFFPERWAGDAAQRIPRFAYFPFGGGPRLCIGSRFAMMEAVLLVACIARRFRLRLDPTCKVEPFPSITLRPAHGLRMTIAARTNPEPRRSATAR